MGILYKGMIAGGMLTAGVLTQAMAGGEPVEASSLEPAATEIEAVETCVAAAAERMAGTVTDSTVTRVWAGREGYIVTMTLVNDAGGRRDFTCREGIHGLHVARG